MAPIFSEAHGEPKWMESMSEKIGQNRGGKDLLTRSLGQREMIMVLIKDFCQGKGNS